MGLKISDQPPPEGVEILMELHPGNYQEQLKKMDDKVKEVALEHLRPVLTDAQWGKLCFCLDLLHVAGVVRGIFTAGGPPTEAAPNEIN